MADLDMYQGDLHFRHQNNDNSYSFIYRLDDESNAEVAARDLAVHIKDEVWPLLQPLHHPNVIAQCATGRQIWPNNSIHETQAIEQPGIRVSFGDALPGQCSMLAQLFGSADNPTPRNRGRDFWSGLCEDDQAQGVWNQAVLDAYQEFYELQPKSFVSVNSNEFSLGVWSRTQALADPSVQFFFHVSLVRLNHLVRTQRRRQPENVCRPFQTFDPLNP